MIEQIRSALAVGGGIGRPGRGRRLAVEGHGSLPSVFAVSDLAVASVGARR
jgi:hypothetical protein